MENLANNAATTLAASCGYSDTTISVASSTGFPATNFRIVVDSELMLVTTVSGTTWTVSRGQESTTAAGHTVGASVANVLTVAGLSAAISQGSVETISGSISESQVTNLTSDLSNRVQTSALGAANGVATLNGSGQLTSSQIPSSLVGAVDYQGLWNASTNSPTLVSSSGSKGNYYVVSTAGTTTLDGISSWNVGDTAIFSGTAWDKIDGIASEVVSVAGRTGAVTLSNTDISGLGSAATQSSSSFAASSTTISASTPLTGGGSLSSNVSLGIQQANTSQAGYLSSTDWNTFNSKGSGTVTSVGMTGDGTVFNSSVTGSPITSSGTLAPSLHTQSANKVFAGPTSGSATAPTFRSLVPADLTAFATDSGSGATFNTSSSCLYLTISNHVSSGTITLSVPSALQYASMLVLDNSQNSDNYAATLASPISQTWTVAAGSISVIPFFRSGSNLIVYPYINYPTSTVEMADGNNLYYPNGSALASGGTLCAASGETFVDDNGQVYFLSNNSVMVDSMGNIYNAASGSLCDSSGNVTGATVTSTGALSSDNGAVSTNGSGTLKAIHISGKSSATAPTISAGAALGTGGSVGATITGANGSGTASDLAGQITLTTGTSGYTSGGTGATVTFGTSFSAAPIVILTAANVYATFGAEFSAGQQMFAYVSATTTSGFTVAFPAGSVYSSSHYIYNYLVVGVDG